MSALFAQLAALWRRQTPLARGAWFVLALAAIVGGSWWSVSQQPAEWVTLITTPYELDAAECVAALQSEGIAARQRAHDVEVEPTTAERARQVLAAAGLPDLSLGMHLFDEASPMRSGLGEQVNLLRAQQEELARSISALQPIERARVHLAMGKPSIFRSQEQAPSASVAVRLHPGASLSPAQVRGVRQLVAGSVTGMRAADVRVIDSQGAVLDDDARRPGDWLAEAERTTADKVLAILERVVGVGKVAVVVSARAAGRGAHDGSAEGGAAAAMSRGSAEGGAAVDGAAADGAVATPDAVADVGVAQLQVAVIVDARARGGVVQPPSEADLAAWRALARSAAGLDEHRGDRLELWAMPFSAPAPAAAAAATPRAPRGASADEDPAAALPLPAVLAAAGGALLLALLLAISMMRAARRRADAAQRRVEALTEELARVEAAAESREEAPSFEQTIEAVRADPQRAALVLAAWLRQDLEAPAGGAPGGGR